MNTKLAKTSRPIHALLARRWSPRAFDEARPIAQETLTQLFEAARWAPSCFNEQPWRYLVCNRVTEPDAWADVLACLVEGNRKWARRAPTFIAAIAASHFRDSGNPNRWAPYDTGAASENMFLQATALGLAMHQMGGFDAAKVHARFGVPAEFEVLAIIALGYPGEPALLERQRLEQELAPRTRRSVSEFTHYGRWRQLRAVPGGAR